MDWLLYEKEVHKNGYNIVCGVDEAGRGPLAGPVYAAAVILPDGYIPYGVNDSKKLTAKKREALYYEITQKAIAWCVATASEIEIDEMNILKATFLAMKRAVNGLTVKPNIVLVDGNRAPQMSMETKTIIKGDACSASIAAASILAKVSRDKFMEELGSEYPQYCFEKHKGYGTRLHVELLREYGPSKVHRKSFLKKILGDKVCE